MNANPSGSPEDLEDEEQALALAIERHWNAISRGEAPEAVYQQALHDARVRSADTVSCLHLVEAIHEAAATIAEDSQSDATVDGSATTHTYRAQAEAPRPNLGVGRTIRGFEIREVLGRGGQAATFKAWDPALRRHIVIKLYHSSADPRQRELILSEGQKLARVRSNYVPECYAVEEIDGAPCLFLEYIPGSNLARLHASRPLPVREALELTAQVAEALQTVHAAGLVHCDVKPSNILVADDGSPRLVDFGLAKSFGDPDLKHPSGTFSYMAPEQARGELERVGPRTDVFSLGATLYFLLTGSAPYAGTTQSELWRAACAGDIEPARRANPQLPRSVSELCMRALAKAPESRFESAAQLAAATRRCMNRRVTGAAAAAAVVGVLLMILAGFIVRASVDRGRPAPSGQLPGPLQVDSVRIEQLLLNSRREHERHGFVVRDQAVLEDAYQLRLGDAVQFQARLSRPAYSFWLAFRPDGVEEICFPPSVDTDKPPPLTDSPAYPLRDKSTIVYGLTDGVGMQVFALIASDEPLPSFEEWRSEMPPSPWESMAVDETPALVHHDGQGLEVFPIDRRQHPNGHTRGAGQKTVVPDGRWEELLAWLRHDGRIVSVELWALPVRPRDSEAGARP